MEKRTKFIIGGVALVAIALLTKKWWMPKKATTGATSDVKKVAETATPAPAPAAPAAAPAPAPAAPLRPLARVANVAVAPPSRVMGAPAMIIDSEK